jgi:hypothetical protein
MLQTMKRAPEKLSTEHCMSVSNVASQSVTTLTVGLDIYPIHSRITVLLAFGIVQLPIQAS